MNRFNASIGLLLLMTPTACVSQGKYDEALQNAQSAQQKQVQTANQAEHTASELAREKKDAQLLAVSLADEQARLKQAQSDAADLQRQLDDGIAGRRCLKRS